MPGPVGLSVAVLLASAMVLSLAPAMLTLFGRAVWWLPGRLARLLPRVDIEGEPGSPPRTREPTGTTRRHPAPTVTSASTAFPTSDPGAANDQRRTAR